MIRGFYFGTYSFEYVWEKLIDRVFGVRDKEKYFPGPDGNSVVVGSVITTPWNRIRLCCATTKSMSSMPSTTVTALLGDLLQIHVTGIKIFDFHITHMYCDYRGLENLFMDLIDNVNMVKDVFAFFTEGLVGLLRQVREMNIAWSNNDYTYHYTGSLGYCDDLPPYANKAVQLDSVWGAAEAQEYASVSPEMFAEAVLPFEKKLLELFGLNGYGCCDDLTEKLDAVLTIRHLRRVAACPWANLGKMVQMLGKDYILTWKPHPALLAGETFDDEQIERYMTEKLTAAKVGYPEIILRDTHTCRGDPSRFTRFVTMAR